MVSKIAYIDQILEGVGTPSIDTLGLQITLLGTYIAEGTWANFTISLIGFIILAIIFLFIFGIYFGDKGSGRKHGLILLTKRDYKDLEDLRVREKHDWLVFIISIPASFLLRLNVCNKILIFL